MLRELFPKYYPSYQRSRWANDLETFGRWLSDAGYSRQCTCRHLYLLRKTLDRETEAAPGGTFTAARLQAAFNSEYLSHRSTARHATRRLYECFLAAHGRLTVPPTVDRFAALRLGYRQYLSELRGFAETTVRQHDATVQDLLARALRPGQALAVLSGADIERYLAVRSTEVTRQTLQHTVAHLRAFLRYAYDQGRIGTRLDTLIDTPRTYRAELPPRALDWRLIQALLRSVDCSSAMGWRDYAILHLMAYYGLRPSEIVTLQLDSIDWHAQTLRVEQCKTRSALLLPLAARTLRILRRYLHRGRPGSHRPELFLRARGPVGALKRTAITDIFDKRARQSGLPLAGYSAYSLRHGFAMRLLSRGVAVKTIGDLLGHRSLESTCQYLRLDVAMLRAVALPVPRLAHPRRLS